MIIFHFQQRNNKVSFFCDIRNQVDKNRLDVCFSPYRLRNKRDSEIIKVRCSFPSKHSQGIVNSIDAQNIKQCGALFGRNRSNENVAKINICENNGASTEGTKRTSGPRMPSTIERFEFYQKCCPIHRSSNRFDRRSLLFSLCSMNFPHPRLLNAGSIPKNQSQTSICI